MFIDFINPSIDNRNFITYKLKNSNCVHIQSIEFENKIHIGGFMIIDSGIYESTFSSEDCYINKDILNENEEIDDLNFILIFNSTFLKDFTLKCYLEDDKFNYLNIPNLIIEYEYVDNTLPFYINSIDCLSYFQNNICSDLRIEDESYMCIGYLLIFNKCNVDCLKDTITFVFSSNTIIKFNFWDCIFLENMDNVCIFPCIDNIQDIFWCIKNNDNLELKKQIDSIQINKENLRLMHIEDDLDLENPSEFDDFDIIHLKEIYINNIKIYCGVCIQSLYLNINKNDNNK